jgi:hypothetical protein
MSALDELLHKNLKDMSLLEFIIWNYYDKYGFEHPLGADKAADELAQLRSDNARLQKAVDSAHVEADMLLEITAQLRNRIKELEARTTWQPIETAPSNKLIVVFIPKYGIFTDNPVIPNAYTGDMIPTLWVDIPEPPK